MKKVYVLGAGFSKPAGGPLAKEMIPRIFLEFEKFSTPIEVEKKKINYPTFIGSLRFIEEFLKTAFSGQECHNYNIEQVLSLLDLALTYGGVSFFTKYGYKELNEVEETILILLSKILSSTNPNQNMGFYSQFVKNLTSDDTIISFNYDLIIENIISDNLSLNWSSQKGYGIKIDPTPPPGINIDGTNKTFAISTLIKMSNAKSSVSRNFSQFLLLKMHGSINWHFCKACNKIFIPGDKFAKPVGKTHGNEYMNMIGCPHCSKNNRLWSLRQLIVPPTYFKGYTIPNLQDVWILAFERLREADEIHFLGYSLSDIDILSYQLFLYANDLNSDCAIFVKDKDPSSIEKNYRQIYGDRIKFIEVDFENHTKEQY